MYFIGAKDLKLMVNGMPVPILRPKCGRRMTLGDGRYVRFVGTLI
jgi:hypothetical protein